MCINNLIKLQLVYNISINIVLLVCLFLHGSYEKNRKNSCSVMYTFNLKRKLILNIFNLTYYILAEFYNVIQNSNINQSTQQKVIYKIKYNSTHLILLLKKFFSMC